MCIRGGVSLTNEKILLVLGIPFPLLHSPCSSDCAHLAIITILTVSSDEVVFHLYGYRETLGYSGMIIVPYQLEV